MIIAVWNVRGLGSSSKKEMVRSLIRKERVEMIGLVESKHTEITMQDINSCWGYQDVEWVQVPAEVGGSGGLILSWLKDSFTLVEVKTMQNWILAVGIMQQSNFRCTICTGYEPNDRHERLVV